MSEEVASAFVERRAFDVLWAEKEQWRDAHERLADAFELHMDIDDCHQAMADYAGIVYDVVLGDLAGQNDQLQSQLAASHEQIATTEAELLAARNVVATAKKCCACLPSSPDMHARLVALSSALKAYRDVVKVRAE